MKKQMRYADKRFRVACSFLAASGGVFLCLRHKIRLEEISPENWRYDHRV